MWAIVVVLNRAMMGLVRMPAFMELVMALVLMNQVAIMLLLFMVTMPTTMCLIDTRVCVLC